MKSWFIYILECKDKTLYTGMTNDIESRIAKHASKKGAKYTRSKGVGHVVYSEKFKTKSEALKRESEIKSWPRKEKLKLIAAS